MFEALEKQLELIEVWKGDPGRQWASKYRLAMARIPGATPSTGDVQALMIHDLENAEPYFVSQKICQLISMTQASYPDVPFLSDNLPTEHGWCYLEDPFPLFPCDPTDNSPFGDPPRLKAFSWSSEVTRDSSGLKAPGLCLTFYEDGRPWPWPISVLTWPFGDKWREGWGWPEGSPGDQITKVRMETLRRYVLALFSFMNQKLVTISKERAPRAVRRRFERKQCEAPILRVVLLRLKEHGHPAGDSQINVEWTCQWIVRGHWRQQWHPGQKTHKALWITPYVKGPEDKPLKKPSTTLFAVTR